MPPLVPPSGNRFAPAIAAFMLVALAAFVMWPALGAGFLQDDWDFLASSAHMPTPLPYLLENYSRGYAYRPNGMLAWWLANRAFGPAPAWHYGLQVLVHASCALALLGLVRRMGGSRLAAIAAAALFVVHPATVATSLWLSDRFDLMAALGLLFCLRLLFSPRLGRPALYAGLAACAWLAVGAKEIGVLVVPLAALALWLRPETGMRTKTRAGLAVLLPTLAWFGLRLMVLGSNDIAAQRDPGALATQFTQGMGVWLGHLPGALALDAPKWTGAVALVFMLVAAVSALQRGRADPLARRAWLGLALLLPPPLLQWPITHFALATPEALSTGVNLRFYFLSLCGVALLVSVVIDAALSLGAAHDRETLLRRALAICAVALVLPMAGQAQQRSRDWTVISAHPDALLMEASLAQRFLASANGAGCKLVFLGASSVNLPGFADHVAKAHLPRGHRALDSLVVTDPMPWSAIVGPAGAGADALSPLPRRMAGPVELMPAPVGPLFYVSMDYRPLGYDRNAPCPTLSFRWDGREFKDITAR